MKKTMVLAMMVALLAVVLSGCATRISRPGLVAETNDPVVARALVNPKDDFSNGIAPAIGASMTGTTGVASGNNADEIAKLKAYLNRPEFNAQTGAVTNSSMYDIYVEIEIGYFPGKIDARQMASSTGIYNELGYEVQSNTVFRKNSRNQQNGVWKLQLKPGDYNVRIWQIAPGQKGMRQIDSKPLHVDVNPGKHIIGQVLNSQGVLVDDVVAFRFAF
jgi:hypothetical protein